jgi:hypothetical protein
MYNNEKFDLFASMQGVRQGENLFPLFVFQFPK